jgi:hypothetical protein
VALVVVGLCIVLAQTALGLGGEQPLTRPLFDLSGDWSVTGILQFIKIILVFLHFD